MMDKTTDKETRKKKKIRRNLLLVMPLAGIAASLVLIGLVFFLSLDGDGAAARPGEMPGHHAGGVAPYAAPIVALEESLHGGHADHAVGTTGEAAADAAAGVAVDGADEAPACDFADWAGKPADEDALKATGRPYRILPPGGMATMDYRADRINVLVDDEGVVLSVNCG